MKTLNDYTDGKISKILEENGAFFAFGKKQFDEQKKEGVKYVSFDSGLLCPENNADKCLETMNNCYEEAMKQRLVDYSKEDIIHYELSNYESYYTGDIEDAFNILSEYGFTKDEVLKVYNDTKHLHYND